MLLIAQSSLCLLALAPLPPSIAEPPIQARASTTEGHLEDAPLEGWRRELLQLACDAGATYPHDPHVKNRARAIERVVLACLELDQPSRALRYNEGITNWRRGAGYVEYAVYAIESGFPEMAEAWLERALEVASTTPDARQQEWRADRIRSLVARARKLLGQDELASELEQGLEPSERGRLERVEALGAAPEDFEGLVESLDRAVATDDFEATRAAVDTYVGLYERFYDDRERAGRIEGKIEAILPKLPRILGFQSLERLAGVAAAKGDAERTLAFTGRIEGAFEQLEWRPQDRVPMTARLAVLYDRIDRSALARVRLDQARTLYDGSLADLQSFERAGTLRPIAAAWAELGESGRALELFRTVVEEGAINPNLRPRIDDLVATCTELALRGVEPDEALWERMRVIQRELASRFED